MLFQCPAGKVWPGETPQERRDGTARGKRPPGMEINTMFISKKLKKISTNNIL
jgi:hypothetical protein